MEYALYGRNRHSNNMFKFILYSISVDNFICINCECSNCVVECDHLFITLLLIILIYFVFYHGYEHYNLLYW
jgi:hypothetical protein